MGQGKFSIKRLLPRSLFARSLLILTVPIVLTMVITTYIFFERHWERMAGRLAYAVAGEVAFLAEQVEHIDDPAELKYLSDNSLAQMQISLRYVEGGTIKPDPVIYTGRGHIIKKFLAQELKYKLKKPYRILIDTNEKWIQVQVQLSEGALIVTSPERRLFSSSGYVFLIWMIGISSVLLIVAILFMRNQIRPIKRLALAAERFGKGRDVPFFKPEGAREVRAAAHSFIGMRDRINKQIQTRTTMLAGVSHDLRTPLTRMKLQVEMLPEGEDRDALKSDIEDMKRMIDAYLQFAKGDGNEAMERTDIVEILKRQKNSFERNGLDVEFEYNEKQNYEIFLRPIAIERCIGNIISNAGHHAKKVWLTLSRDEDEFEIIIDDNGSGIDPEQYDDVFKPFYREEKSRNKKTGGVGLGLSIAQDIILAHGGDIILDKSPQGGLRVIINLTA